MQTVDLAGARLDPKSFIKIFRDVVKLAPARFWTLRVHPSMYKQLYVLADVPESIQVGDTPGMLGRRITKINSIRPPQGVSDGITIIQDKDASPSNLFFELHGIPEYRV